MWACEKGHFEIVKLLVEHGADVDWKNEVGCVKVLFIIIHIMPFIITITEGLDCFTLCLFQQLCEDCQLPNEKRS